MLLLANDGIASAFVHMQTVLVRDRLVCSRPWHLTRLFVLSAVMFSVAYSHAQHCVPPESASDAAATRQQTEKPAKRTPAFLAYATNRSLIFPDIATSAGPMKPSSKFKLFVNQSISPPYVAAAGLTAAISQARDAPPGYGQGWDAFGSRFGADMARAASNSFFATFVFASLLHQDPRFFPQANPGFWRSMKYSAQLIVFTRSDSGTGVLNTSGLLGPLASEGLANLYLPSAEQTFAKTATRFAVDLTWRFAGSVFKNYWPSIFHEMGLNRLKVIPDPRAK